jgi:NAD(P)-dependent dehydrogenase (short-subunit alcohol dehydrogenase family)
MAIDPWKFDGKRALIFGAARGMGKTVALEIARRGAAVALADLRRDEAEEGAAEIVSAGGKAVALTCDVTKDESVRQCVEDAERALGDLDLVHNNVGALITGSPEDVPVSEWERIWNLNLMPVVRSNHVVLPKMLARGSGYIVNTASFAGLYPYGANRTPYVAAKTAVVGLTESLAVYLLPKGIRVSCFCPGPVLTQVMEGVKNWTPDAPMLGPGSQFALIKADEAARVLADGMEAGRIIIPTHEGAFDMMRRHGADPDGFIRERIAAFAAGDHGRPTMKPA